MTAHGLTNRVNGRENSLQSRQRLLALSFLGSVGASAQQTAPCNAIQLGSFSNPYQRATCPCFSLCRQFLLAHWGEWNIRFVLVSKEFVQAENCQATKAQGTGLLRPFLSRNGMTGFIGPIQLRKLWLILIDK